MDKKVILVIGDPGAGKCALILQDMKEKYGDDIILVTPEEAKAQGITEFANKPSMKITAPPLFFHDQPIYFKPVHGKMERRQFQKRGKK